MRGRNMAARKKEHALAGFTVVLEDIRSQFRVFGEALQGIRETMDARFGAVDCRFDAVDRRFDAVEARADRTDGELALVKVAVLENSRELKELRGAVSRLVDRNEVEVIVARALARCLLACPMNRRGRLAPRMTSP